jgi:hypothetical protein
VTAEALAHGVGATPMDQYLIWDGRRYDSRPGSRCSRALSLITEVGTPVALRELVLRAARIEGDYGFRPEAVRSAVRQHQAAVGACYLLVRRTSSGDYVSVTDVPFPATGHKSFRAGHVILSRGDERSG